MGFLNATLAGALKISQFMEQIENRDFGILDLTVLARFSQFTKQLGNLDF